MFHRNRPRRSTNCKPSSCAVKNIHERTRLLRQSSRRTITVRSADEATSDRVTCSSFLHLPSRRKVLSAGIVYRCALTVTFSRSVSEATTPGWRDTVRFFPALRSSEPPADISRHPNCKESSAPRGGVCVDHCRRLRVAAAVSIVGCSNISSKTSRSARRSTPGRLPARLLTLALCSTRRLGGPAS